MNVTATHVEAGNSHPASTGVQGKLLEKFQIKTLGGRRFYTQPGDVNSHSTMVVLVTAITLCTVKTIPSTPTTITWALFRTLNRSSQVGKGGEFSSHGALPRGHGAPQ